MVGQVRQREVTVTCYPGVISQGDTEPYVEKVEEVVVPSPLDDDDSLSPFPLCRDLINFIHGDQQLKYFHDTY